MDISKIYHGGGSGKKTGFSGSMVDTDVKVKVTNADTTADFLNPKVAVSGLVKNVLNPGGNEQLQIVNPGVVACTNADTTLNYLQSKLIAGTNITLTLQNPAGNENIKIDAAGGTPVTKYTLCFGTGLSIAPDVFLKAVAGAATYPTNGGGYYIGVNSIIREFHVLYHRFTCYNSSHSCTMQLKRLTGDGSRTSDITSESGTNIYNLLTTFPNTSGSFQYFRGDCATGLSYAINAGQMLFCVSCAKTVNSVTGCSAYVILEQA